MFAHVASPFLRRVLLIDAAASAAAGLAMAVGANLLEDVLGLPATLLSEAGLILFPFAIYVVAIARRDRISPAAVFAVIACNAVWALGSIALLVSGLVAPTLLGYAFVIGQAIAVGALGELQFMALRRARPATA